jgi:hypothetical protein
VAGCHHGGGAFRRDTAVEGRELMSAGRMRKRVTLLATGVLVSVALTAAPAWAAKPGNSIAAKACEAGYSGVLLNELGEPVSFKNEGQCSKFAAHGQLVGVNVVSGVESNGELIDETCTGFGLRPGSETVCGALYEMATTDVYEELEDGVAARDGTWTLSHTVPCEPEGLRVETMFVEATTASGTPFRREFGAPYGCLIP